MRIALGITGGIAAYKAAEIVRLVQDRGIRVQVVMTRAAQEFIRPLTFAALSAEKVITGMFAAGEEHEPNLDSAIEHIAVAQSIDALLVVPATADVLAQLSVGTGFASNPHDYLEVAADKAYVTRYDSNPHPGSENPAKGGLPLRLRNDRCKARIEHRRRPTALHDHQVNSWHLSLREGEVSIVSIANDCQANPCSRSIPNGGSRKPLLR